MPTLTITTTDAEGNEVEQALEVPADALKAAGFVPATDLEQLKEFHKKEIKRVSDRFDDAARRTMREELEADEAFIKRLVAEHGGKADVDVKALREQFRKEELSPVKTTLEDLTRELRNSEVRQAAGKHFDLNNPFISVEGKYGEEFSYDTARRQTLHRDGLTPDEFFGKLAQDERFREYVRPEARNKAGDGAHLSGKPPTGGAPPKVRYRDMTDTQRVAYQKEHGNEALTALMVADKQAAAA